MLIEQERIAVGVGDHEARGAFGRLVGLGRELDAALLQNALQLAHVLEVRQCLLVRRPSRIEGHDVFFEHPLKQTDPRVPVLKDDPSLFEFAGHFLEAEILVEGFGCLDVLDRETDRKITQLKRLLFLGLSGLRRGYANDGDRGKRGSEREGECFHVNSPKLVSAWYSKLLTMASSTAGALWSSLAK